MKTKGESARRNKLDSEKRCSHQNASLARIRQERGKGPSVDSRSRKVPTKTLQRASIMLNWNSVRKVPGQNRSKKKRITLRPRETSGEFPDKVDAVRLSVEGSKCPLEDKEAARRWELRNLVFGVVHGKGRREILEIGRAW